MAPLPTYALLTDWLDLHYHVKWGRTIEGLFRRSAVARACEESRTTDSSQAQLQPSGQASSTDCFPRRTNSFFYSQAGAHFPYILPPPTIMRYLNLLSALWTFVAVGMAYTEYGLTGFPANMYYPVCGTACIRSFYTMMLNCSSEGEMIGMVHLMKLTECYAENTAYLTSVAWCTNVHYQDEKPPADLLESWWDMQITDQKVAGARTVPAKWTYSQALAQVLTPPTVQLTAEDTELNTTSLVAPAVWQAQYNVLYSTQREGTVMNGYGFVFSAKCLTFRTLD